LSSYSSLLRPLLFSLDAETAHNLTLSLLSSPLGATAAGFAGASVRAPRLQQEVFGLRFDNPVGLAAGLDKQGTAVGAWERLGFGFAEVGTVTPRPQPGNPRPRLFRLPDEAAVINRFGFNSEGADAVARHLAQARARSMRVGVNLGKNKDTPNDGAADDYLRGVEALHRHADYFVVNVSSPNTPGLRDLQEARLLRDLLSQVVGQVARLSAGRSIPVLVKVSPDLQTADLLASVDAALEGGAAGIIATNTTISRSSLISRDGAAQETGGLSGVPLRAAANATCRALYRHLGPRVPIIGVGGIDDTATAYERIRSGASLVQIYTALIYEGPALAARIVRGLAERLERDGLPHLRDAIGTDVV
jgi:dihydroorotate dehydrogenase